MWSSVLLGKASAYLGLTIGVLLLLDPPVLLRRWYRALTQRDELSGFAWALLVSLLYGVGEVVYGVVTGNPLSVALEVFVYNICPMYVFLGIWAGARRPEIVRKYIRYQAWFTVLYVPLYFLVFNKIHISLSGILPGSNMDLLGQPGTGTGTLLGLFAYEPNLARFWLPILLLSFLTIANQIRADWLGLGIALLIWGTATKQLGRVFGIGGLLVALLGIGFIADLRIPAFAGRGGEISARETVARALGSISPELALNVGDTSASNARFYYGTVYWRTVWWAGIRAAVSETYHTLVFGLGYGYPIKELGVSGLKNGDIRSPHNIFYFVLAYSGLLGVALFFWLQLCVLRLLWQTFKATGQIYGLAYYSALLVGAFFGNFLETPQAGIPTYLVVGLCVGPLFRHDRLRAKTTGAAGRFVLPYRPSQFRPQGPMALPQNSDRPVLVRPSFVTTPHDS